MSEKKDGGIISHWELHTLSFTPEKANEMGYEVYTDKVYVMTGTVVSDPTGRWLPGYHMKSSVISKMDLEEGVVETQNTFYKLEGERGDVFPDLGDGVGSIFY